MQFRRTSLLLALAFAAGCSANDATLQVRVYTGLVPGPEFATVRTTVLASSREVGVSEARARFGNDFARGRQVASFEMAQGEYRVRVQLMRPNGALLVERVVALSLNGNTVLPVHLTRDCVGVVCPAPGGSAELSTCLAGRCVDPRCTPTTREFCPTVAFCNVPAECGATASCAQAACEDGVCTPAPIDNACDDTEWCNPDVGAGCQPFEDEEPSLPSSCGTICTEAEAPCRFGYWNCESGAPVCMPLQNRPSDFVCGPGLTCDVSGECTSTTVETPRIVVTPTSGLVTNESGTTARFTVALATAPSANVFIVLASSDTSEGTPAPSALAFTTANWATPQTVTVTGIDDGIDDGNIPYAILTMPASSADVDYNGMDADDVSVLNREAGEPGLTVLASPPLETSEEGTSEIVQLRLTTMPSADVTLTVHSSDASEVSIMPLTFTFTPSNYTVLQTLTITGVNDSVEDGDHVATIIFDALSSTDADYNGVDPDDLTVTNRDNDMVGVTVSPTAGLITAESGLSATFTVRLNTQPSGDVTIPLSSSNTDEGNTDASLLTFTSTNWSIPQTVTIVPVDDALIESSVSYNIILGPVASDDSDYNALSVDSVSVMNIDDDSPPSITVNRTSLETSELGTVDSFTLWPTYPISDSISIGIANDEPGEVSLSQNIITFSPSEWPGAVTITVTGLDDGVLDGDRIVNLTLSNTVSSTPAYNNLPVDDVTVINRTRLVQEVYLKASNPDVNDQFGRNSVAISGDGNTLAVGVYIEASSATGIGGNQASNSMTLAGAVYVFTRSGSTWTQQAYIKASNTNMSDAFGYALGLSADGNTLVVGAPQEQSDSPGIDGNQFNNSVDAAGAAYVFRRVGTTWSQEAYVKASTVGWALFGISVSVSSTGNDFVIGAVFESSTSTGVNGDETVMSIIESGAAYVFTRIAGEWAQEAYVKASNTEGGDSFATSVCLSGDGNTLAISAISEDSNATGIDGNQADNSASRSGAVYVYVRNAGVWAQQAYVKASNAEANDQFGMSIALSEDGNTMAVGATSEGSSASGVNGNQADNSLMGRGAAYAFVRSGSTWTQQAYLKPPTAAWGAEFGVSMSISADGNRLAVGYDRDWSGGTGVNANPGDAGAPNSGAVMMFERVGTMWTSSAYIKASNTGMSDQFGERIALSRDGTTLAAGAGYEDSNAVGVGGDQTNNLRSDSGAIYVFNLE